MGFNSGFKGLIYYVTSQNSKEFNHTKTEASYLQRAGLQILGVCKYPTQYSHDSRRADGHYKKRHTIYAAGA